MGKPLTASQETQLLKDTIREAHETIKDLRAVIREARELAPTLVAEFEATHKREIHQVSNHIAAESNRIAAVLNDQIERATAMIFSEIMAGDLVLDPATMTVRLQLGSVKFDDSQPPPYPEVAPKGSHQ